MPLPGEIYRHDRFYRNEQGGWEAKYLVMLAFTPAQDIIHRTLTSRIRRCSTRRRIWAVPRTLQGLVDS